MNSYFNHSRSCLAAGLPKAGPRALLLNTCHPWGLEGRALSATGQGHTTLQVERCKQGQLPERGALSYHSLQFSFLWQSQASEMTSESAGYFKAQSSNSPPNNIFNVDLFKTGFLILSKRLTCCDRRVRGFGGSSESLTPAQLSACILHNHAWDTWDKVSGMERSPRRVFYPLQHLWLLCVTGNWGEHQLQRF